MANPYQAPLALVRLALNQAAEISGARALPGYDEVLSELAEPILENASRFAGAYRRFCADGWVSLAAATEHGGQGLPTLISAAVTEMWGGANLSFAMCPELT